MLEDGRWCLKFEESREGETGLPVILETGGLLPFIAHNRCQLSLYDLPYAVSTPDPFKSGAAGGLMNQVSGPEISAAKPVSGTFLTDTGHTH